MKILHVTFNMGFGGTEQVIRQLVSGAGLASNTIVCIDGAVGPIGVELEKEGVRILSIARRPGMDWAMIAELRQVIREGRFDIVHCHQYTPFFYGRLASFGTGARVVFTEHGRFHPDRYRWKALPVNRVLGLVTPGIVAISSATRDALARYEWLPKNRIRVIYNGVRGLEYDAEGAGELRQSLGIPSGDVVMGTVARLDPVKNQAMMLQSFEKVLSRSPDRWLLMVGDGPERTKLEQLSRDLGIDRRVRFVGFQNAPANYLAAMDVFLLSSHTEGTSMTLLEAMSLGVPAVATDVGGNSEIITHEKTGLLAPAGDTEGFSQSIERLLCDSALYRKIQHESRREFQRRFSVEGMVRAYKDLYLRVLARPES